MISFPNIDPVIFDFGLFQLRWYGLMYILGFVGGYFVVRWQARLRGLEITRDSVLDLFGYLAIGVILGGRLGYVVFYNLPLYLDNPLKILFVWEGGMSFHGGLIGTVLAGIYFAKRRGLPVYKLADVCSVGTPVGLGLGRIGNFINGELYGRVSDVPWAMVFPNGGSLPRHPSQLYEALLEGPVLFFVLVWLSRRIRADGALFWSFIGGYAIARFIVEFFREPDPQLGLILGPFSMGQLLSFAMFVAAAAFFVLRTRR